jgi:hypothetical protein
MLREMDASERSSADLAEETKLTEEAREAFQQSRFKDAFAIWHAGLLNKALRFCRDEGIYFERAAKNPSPTELVVGLALAANSELRERDVESPFKLAAATWMFSAVADLRMALDEPVEAETDAFAEKLAQLTLISSMVGQVDMIMHAVDQGWLDKAAAYEVMLEQRRAGAAKANAKKATVKEKALGSAIQVASKNTRLSHEELAVHVRKSLGLNTTIATMTKWVREWRRKGYLPPINTS